jgi:hypothetical protein
MNCKKGNFVQKACPSPLRYWQKLDFNLNRSRTHCQENLRTISNALEQPNPSTDRRILMGPSTISDSQGGLQNPTTDRRILICPSAISKYSQMNISLFSGAGIV